MDNYFVRYETLEKVAKDSNRTIYENIKTTIHRGNTP